LGKVLSSLHEMKLGGKLDFVAALQVAQLALKHRQNKTQHQRAIVFVGSPVEAASNDLVKLGKRLKKNNIAVDIINFGEEAFNTEKLEAFIGAVNNNNNSHLITIPPGPHILSDILLSSSIIRGDDDIGSGVGTPQGGAISGGGAGGYFVDPNLDPELALALKVSLEEERARQENSEAKPSELVTTKTTGMEQDDDALLAEALAMSMGGAPVSPSSSPSAPVIANTNQPQPDMMDDDDDIKMALQMSMEQSQSQSQPQSSQPLASSSDISRIMEDPNFVNQVLMTLPGVDPNDERIKSVLASFKTSQNVQEKEEEEKKKNNSNQKKDEKK